MIINVLFPNDVYLHCSFDSNFESEMVLYKLFLVDIESMPDHSLDRVIKFFKALTAHMTDKYRMKMTQ